MSQQVCTKTREGQRAAADLLAPDLWRECPKCFDLCDPRLDFCPECHTLLALLPNGSWVTRRASTSA